jgi:hypothetical protein
MRWIPSQAMPFVQALWRHRWLAVGTAWLVCTAGWVGVAFIPTKYESTARVYLNADPLLTPLTWARNMRPDLNGFASLGYYNSSNVITTTGAAPVSSLNTITAYLGVNYSFAQNLTGSVLYSFSYQSNGAGGAVGKSADIVVNQLTLQLSKTF